MPSPPTRRHVLTALGSAGALGLAGCTAGLSDEDDPEPVHLGSFSIMNRDGEPHEVTVLLTGPEGPLFLGEYALESQDTEGDSVLEEGPIHEGETTLTMYLLVDRDVSAGLRLPEEGAAEFPLADRPVSGCVRGIIEITSEGNADPSFRDDEIATDYC